MHILISSAREYVTLHDKRDFAAVIKLRILRRGAYPELFKWVQLIARVLITGKQESQSELGVVLMEVEVRVQCFNSRGRVKEQWTQAAPRNEERLRKYITSESLRKEHSSADTLI